MTMCEALELRTPPFLRNVLRLLWKGFQETMRFWMPFWFPIFGMSAAMLLLLPESKLSLDTITFPLIFNIYCLGVTLEIVHSTLSNAFWINYRERKEARAKAKQEAEAVQLSHLSSAPTPTVVTSNPQAIEQIIQNRLP
jgi:hypothetical protein